MRFIQIRPGFNVRLDAIEAVEEDGGGCTVFTIGTAYKSTIPFSTLMVLLKNEPDNNSLLKNISNNQQSFAG